MNHHRLDVACAVILRQDQKILAARRPRGKHLAGKWEFPGGKIEPGETSGDALIREIREELGTDILLLQALPLCVHDYPDFHIRLHPWLCRLAGAAEPVPNEHEAVTWLSAEALHTLDWAEADLPILEILPSILARISHKLL
jgi:8-oxo-dGTP diphosphatase